MRRALAILKYLPAVMCGLLLVAWVVSFFVRVTFKFPASRQTTLRSWELRIETASLVCFYDSLGYDTTEPRDRVPTLSIGEAFRDGSISDYMGWTFYDRKSRPDSTWEIRHGAIGIPAALTLLLPVAVGCLTRFRFPLWSYFAWTALIAAELAYYLR